MNNAVLASFAAGRFMRTTITLACTNKSQGWIEKSHPDMFNDVKTIFMIPKIQKFQLTLISFFRVETFFAVASLADASSSDILLVISIASYTYFTYIIDKEFPGIDCVPLKNESARKLPHID